VRAWREKHPKYGRESRLSADPLQEMIMGQPVDGIKKSGGLALQEMIPPKVRESVEEIGL
jgi:hypothetical protein